MAKKLADSDVFSKKKVKVGEPDATLHKEQTGLRLGEAIKSLGKTQRSVAIKYGISPSKLGHWIRGRHYPDQYFIFQFCRDFSVTTDWIYRGVVFGLPTALEESLGQQKPESPEVSRAKELQAP